jgi:hypothetical protein
MKAGRRASSGFGFIVEAMNMRSFWFSFSQVVTFVVTELAFFQWAPWVTAMSREDALREYGQPIPPQWHAVLMEHGKLHEFRWGTVHDNPWGFALCTAVFLGGWLFLILSVRKSRKAIKASRVADDIGL